MTYEECLILGDELPVVKIEAMDIQDIDMDPIVNIPAIVNIPLPATVQIPVVVVPSVGRTLRTNTSAYYGAARKSPVKPATPVARGPRTGTARGDNQSGIGEGSKRHSIGVTPKSQTSQHWCYSKDPHVSIHINNCTPT